GFKLRNTGFTIFTRICFQMETLFIFGTTSPTVLKSFAVRVLNGNVPLFWFHSLLLSYILRLGLITETLKYIKLLLIYCNFFNFFLRKFFIRPEIRQSKCHTKSNDHRDERVYKITPATIW